MYSYFIVSYFDPESRDIVVYFTEITGTGTFILDVLFLNVDLAFHIDIIHDSIQPQRQVLLSTMAKIHYSCGR